MLSTMNDLLLHPIRLRIVSAMTGDRVTAKDIAKALPDIPQTTLYRHINVLVDGGLLQVIDEIPQRGTVERVFGFRVPPSLSPEDLRGLSKEEYQQTFTLILTTLLQEAINSLNSLPENEEIDLLGEGYQFSQMSLNLTDEEYEKLNNRILALMLEAGKKRASEKRKRRIFSYLFIPVIETPEPNAT
jgi:DNA-binding transcriptional ArsR family regulator